MGLPVSRHQVVVIDSFECWIPLEIICTPQKKLTLLAEIVNAPLENGRRSISNYDKTFTYKK